MPILPGLFPGAPEGRKNVAQGVSPGTRSPNEAPAPEGRKNLQRWLLLQIGFSYEIFNLQSAIFNLQS
jgi:hypothetical protein